jgi:hypothetical protein
MKKLAIPIVLAVFLAGAAFLALGGSNALADMEIARESGTVFVHRDGDVIEVGEGRVSLQIEDVVTTGPRGFARLKLEGNRIVRMQPKSRVLIESKRAIEVEAGSVLAAPHNAAMTVRFDDTEATASKATFRVDKGFGSARAGSYNGRVKLDAPGQSQLTLKPLREASVAAGDLPGRPAPYRLNEKDPWDADLLAEVVELEDELELIASGFSRQVGNDRPDLAYFGTLAGRDVGFMRKYLKRRAVDLLIGFTVADNDTRRPLPKSFETAFGYYDAGATWGITAAIMKVPARPVVAQLEDVILGTQVVTAGGSIEEPEFSVAAAAAAESGGPGAPNPGNPPPDTGADGEDPPPPAAENNDEGAEEENPPPEEECGDVVCEVQRRLSPSPSSEDEQNQDEDPGVLDGIVGDGPGP